MRAAGVKNVASRKQANTTSRSAWCANLYLGSEQDGSVF